MNWGALKAEIRRELKDYSADGTAHWDNDTLVRRANIIQREIARESRCVVDTESVSIVAGTREYTRPTLYIDTLRIAIDGRKLYGIDIADLDMATLDGTLSGPWADVTGKPECYYETNNGRYIGYWPTPDASYVASHEYATYPVDMTTDDSYPFNTTAVVGDQTDREPGSAMALVYGVCWLCALESDERKAMVYKTMYDRELMNFIKQHHYKPDKMISFSLFRTRTTGLRFGATSPFGV